MNLPFEGEEIGSFMGCWYNEEGKEACPICKKRTINTVKTITTDVCKEEGSKHKYIITAKCFECDITYKFYHDDVGRALHAVPVERKLEPYKEEVKIPSETTKKKTSKSKKSKVEELASEIADNIKVG